MKKKVMIIMILIIMILISMVVFKENKVAINKWCKQQSKEFKLRVFKNHLLYLQQKYGPDGALET